MFGTLELSSSILPIAGSLGLLGLLGLTISATTGLLPGLTGTSGMLTLPPLSRSSLVISFSPTLFPFSSLMTTLSPGFTLPSVGTVTSTVVLPWSLSPLVFSSSEILPSWLLSSGNSILDGLFGLRVSSGSNTFKFAPKFKSAAPPPTLSTGPAKDPAPKGFIALVSALIFE